MVRYCSVPQCFTYCTEPGISFHYYPEDQQLRKQWMVNLKNGKDASRYTMVCSKHFTVDDFKLLKPNNEAYRRRILKKNAVPSQNLPQWRFDARKLPRKPPASRMVHQNRLELQEHMTYRGAGHVGACLQTQEHCSTASSLTKMLQTDLAPTVDMAVGPSHSVCGVTSSTQTLTITLNRGTQTCPSNFDDHPSSSAMPRLQGFSCERCERVFYTQDILDAHECSKQHRPAFSRKGGPSSVTMYTCAYCPYTNFKSVITRHERTHTGERPFVCRHCQKSFALQATLQAHLQQVHLRGGPYKCPQCDESFGWRASLDKHLLFHMRNRPHACPQCGKRFQERRHARRHETEVHSGLYKLHCPYCGKGVSFKGRLISHMRVHHGYVDEEEEVGEEL